MKKKKIIVSVDGGGTNTRVVLSIEGTNTFKQFNFGVNYKKCTNVEESFQKVTRYIDNVVGLHNVDHFVFGLAGIDLDAQKDIDVYKKMIFNAMRIESFDEKVRIFNDIYLVDGLLPRTDEDRIIVICATGSNVLHKSGKQIQTNTDIGFHSLGGTRHIVEHFINSTSIEESPLELKELVMKYKDTAFDKNQLEVIEDFKKASFVLLDNLDNEYCKNACLFGIHSMINAIKEHTKGRVVTPSIYLYGGQFKSESYRLLFIETLEKKGVPHSQITHITEEAVYGGLHI